MSRAWVMAPVFEGGGGSVEIQREAAIAVVLARMRYQGAAHRARLSRLEREPEAFTAPPVDPDMARVKAEWNAAEPLEIGGYLPALMRESLASKRANGARP